MSAVPRVRGQRGPGRKPRPLAEMRCRVRHQSTSLGRNACEACAPSGFKVSFAHSYDPAFSDSVPSGHVFYSPGTLGNNSIWTWYKSKKIQVQMLLHCPRLSNFCTAKALTTPVGRPSFATPFGSKGDNFRARSPEIDFSPKRLIVENQPTTFFCHCIRVERR